jgi:hypothetical protein
VEPPAETKVVETDKSLVEKVREAIKKDEQDKAQFLSENLESQILTRFKAENRSTHGMLDYLLK